MTNVGITNCVELNWWDSYLYTKKNEGSPSSSSDEKEGEVRKALEDNKAGSVQIVFTPAKHWTSRTPWDKNSVLWGSYAVLCTSARFWFSGDTAYDDKVFKTIGSKYGPFHIAAIGIGAYRPRYFMKDSHVNPEEAVRIHQDLGALQSVGIHWGTFPLSDEDPIGR